MKLNRIRIDRLRSTLPKFALPTNATKRVEIDGALAKMANPYFSTDDATDGSTAKTKATNKAAQVNTYICGRNVVDISDNDEHAGRDMPYL